MRLHPSLTLSRIEDGARRQMFGTDNPGFCVACGHEQYGCEPDAREYECNVCDEPKVYGAQELVIMLA